MIDFRRILVPLSLTASDRTLLRYARMCIHLFEPARIDFVHVLGPAYVGAGQTGPTRQKALVEIEHSVSDLVGPAIGPCEVRREVLTGTRLDQLLTYSAEEQTDLIVLGHKLERSGRRSLARRLAMKAPCSMWLAPNGSPDRISKIVVPIDFSNQSAEALTTAAVIAKRLELPGCTALHVYYDQTAASFEEYDAVVRENFETAFGSFVSRLETQGVVFERLFLEAPSVSRAVSHLAEQGKLDLIVMGSRGQSRSAAILLGSESEQVISETSVPVLVVKQPGERIGLLQVLLDREFRTRQEPRFA